MEPQLKPQHQQHNTAFVLGNGRSRLAINPTPLLEHGAVYGCNAIYREFEPHYLIAVDVKMVNEIIGAGYNKTHEVWTNPNKGISSKNYLNMFNPHKGWSSGPTALWLAASRGHKHIYILGFDYQGEAGKFNNVYADTFNYKKSTDTATFFGNWLNQTERVIQEFKHTKFYRVIDTNTLVPDKLGKISNVEHISINEFQNRYQDTIYSEQMNQKTII
jgi:hypothetical protein